MGYGHLSIDERERIMKMTAQGYSYGQIAERLGRHKGTISREWRRNVSSTGEYKPHLAQRYYERRRAASKEPYRLEEDAPLRKYVKQKLRKYWSPEQISGRIKKERGTNENTNGLLRQFFAKGMDFGTILQSDVDMALALLNNRPRKCLNYRTPTEVFWSKPICCASD
jgi:IS30 family transposase